MRFLILLVLLASFTSPGVAQADAPVVAVSDIKNEARLKRSFVSSMREIIAAELAASAAFSVVPNSDAHKAIREKQADSYKASYDESSQIEIGKEIAPNKTLATVIQRAGSSCIVTTTIFDLRKSVSENAGRAKGGCKEYQVVDSIYEAMWQLLGKKGERLKTAGFAKDLPEVSLPEVEQLSTAVVKLDLTGINIDFLEKWQAYTNHHKAAANVDRSKVPASQKLRAWDIFLSRRLNRIPRDLKKAYADLRAQGQDRRSKWKAVSKAEADKERKWKQATARYRKDKAELDRYLGLENRILSKKQKQAYKREFNAAYGPYIQEQRKRSLGTLAVSSSDRKGRRRHFPFWLNGKQHLSPKKLRLLPGSYKLSSQVLGEKHVTIKTKKTTSVYAKADRIPLSKKYWKAQYDGVWARKGRAVVYRTGPAGNISKEMNQLLGQFTEKRSTTIEQWLANKEKTQLSLVRLRLSGPSDIENLVKTKSVIISNKLLSRRHKKSSGWSLGWGLIGGTFGVLPSLIGLAANLADGDQDSANSLLFGGLAITGVSVLGFLLSDYSSGWVDPPENKRRRKIRESLRLSFEVLPDPQP
jgi:hypothetical protein